jgi:xanthine dehydrogenase accessory factor
MVETMSTESLDPMGEATRRLDRGEPVVLATVIRIDGTPPCKPGQKLLVAPTGALAGTLGCPGFDARTVEAAGPLLATGEPVVETYQHQSGTFDVYLEPMQPRPLLLVLGGTPLAEHLLRMGHELGYTTALVESRPDRITDGHRAAADRVATSLAGVPVGPATDAVHTDHDAPGVGDDLAALVRSPARFVGALGSRHRSQLHLQALREAGCTEDEVARLRTPVGLNIGSRTPAEIALSILSGMVAARTGKDAAWMDRPQPATV